MSNPNTKHGVVVFDFDGVIGDSVYECYVQSLKAAKDLGMKLQHSTVVEKQFREARPLITKADHFFTVVRLMEQNPKINFNHITQDQMNAAFKADAEKSKAFLEKFYAHRKEMQAISPREWTALNKSFPKVARFIRDVKRRSHVYIATTKDRKSVLELLARYGIAIPEKNIVAVDFSKDKREQLKEVSRLSGTPLNKMVLVEDAVEQIKAARELGVKGMLYPRGYSSATQKKWARKEKVPFVEFKKKREVRKLTRVARR